MLALYRPFSQFPIAKEWHDPKLLHPALQAYKQTTQIDSQWISDDEIQKAIASYYALVTFLDSQVGIVLEALKEAGLEADTRILYLDDHGDSAGDHGLFFKSTMNEGSVRIPLILAGEDIPHNLRIKENVSIVDIYPTLLDFYNLKPTPEEKALPGISLLETLRGQNDPNRCIYSEYHAAGYPKSIFMLRKKNYKFIRYLGYEQVQLFDLDHDPNEENDLGTCPQAQPIIDDFNQELRKICDPEALYQQSMADQKALIAAKGGLETILKQGLTPYTAVPKGLGIDK